jgi:RNA polymerase primary sigma factor
MYEGLNSTQDKNFLIYHREVGRLPPLTQEEESKIINLIKSDDKEESTRAKQKLIESNLRLVVKVASNYSNLGMEMLDLISEGNLGLVRAAEKFDSSKGARFSTYACYWIKQSIKRALSNKSRTIRLPVHLTQLFYSINIFIKRFESENERPPSDEEISDGLNVSVEKVRKTKSANLLNTFTRLDEKFNDEDEGEDLSSAVGDYSSVDPAEFLSILNDKQTLAQEIADTLSEREQCVIKKRFGLENNDYYTLEQLGAEHNLTRERIRQIESEALKKLRTKLSKKMS